MGGRRGAGECTDWHRLFVHVSKASKSWGKGLHLCEGLLVWPLPPSRLSRGQFPHCTPAVACLFGLPVFWLVGLFFFSFSICCNVGSGGCAAGGGQPLGRREVEEDAHLSQAISRGNWVEGTGVLELGERGKKVAGGRKEKEIIFKNFISCLDCRKGKACDAQRAAGLWCTKKT